MRAVTIHNATDTDSIRVTDRTVREVGPNEVRIRVAAAAVNPADIVMWRSLGGGSVEVPFVAGMDIAGIVESVGPGVDHLAVGDRAVAVVFPRRPEGGGQAELVIGPAASAVKLPAGIDLQAASTLPMNGLTALQGLSDLNLPRGATIAVTGGAGVLASYAIPLAKKTGLRVIADAHPADADLVASFGADLVVPRGEQFATAVREVAPAGVDGILDTATITRQAVPAIRDHGAIAVVRGWDDEGGEPDRGVVVHRVSVGNALQNTAWLTLLANEAASGRLQLRVASSHTPEQAHEAYRATEAGGIRGRAVIDFN